MFIHYKKQLIKNMDINFVDLVKKALESENNFIGILPEEIDDLLDESYSETTPRIDIIGYPTRPLYREIGNILKIWHLTGECPTDHLPRYDLLDEKGYNETRLANFAQVKELLDGLQSLWFYWTDEERVNRIKKILEKLGKRGILDLIGIRKTVGSKDLFPPPRSILENTFNALNNPNSELTVGARALAKHSHRDETASWWGVCTGRELQKNIHAKQILAKILDNATWINIHWLPHDVIICEIRQENGYGARWTHDGDTFRGFLEPQMIGGHDTGWKH